MCIHIDADLISRTAREREDIFIPRRADDAGDRVAVGQRAALVGGAGGQDEVRHLQVVQQPAAEAVVPGVERLEVEADADGLPGVGGKVNERALYPCTGRVARHLIGVGKRAAIGGYLYPTLVPMCAGFGDVPRVKTEIRCAHGGDGDGRRGEVTRVGCAGLVGTSIKSARAVPGGERAPVRGGLMIEQVPHPVHLPVRTRFKPGRVRVRDRKRNSRGGRDREGVGGTPPGRCAVGIASAHLPVVQP